MRPVRRSMAKRLRAVGLRRHAFIAKEWLMLLRLDPCYGDVGDGWLVAGTDDDLPSAGRILSGDALGP